MTRRRLSALLALAALTLTVRAVSLAPPASVWDVFVQDRPAAVMGDPVPPIAKTPLARLAIAGATGATLPNVPPRRSWSQRDGSTPSTR